jgi:hypothetical protein
MMTLQFWFTMTGQILPLTRVILLVLAVFFCGYLLYVKFNKDVLQKSFYRQIFKEFTSFSQINLLITLYLWFVMEQVVPVLSARAWFIVWLVEIIVWLVNINRLRKKIPETRQTAMERKKFQKYIP